jgi:SWI/SNF-related matrix-associated actin-dependent regulator of chromatin subfamily A member 5
MDERIMKQSSSDEEGPHSDKDGEYLPEHKPLRRSLEPQIDSQAKLQHLMEQIDRLTHSLNTYSQRVSLTQKPSDCEGSKRRLARETEDEQDLVSLDETLYTVKLTEQPRNIVNGQLRFYQIEGLNWLLKMKACNINGILADEMGLGKTLQTISLMAQLALLESEGHSAGSSHLPSIVIVPKNTLSNWLKEFSKWAPSLRVFEFYGSNTERETLRPKVPRADTYDILVTTYEIVMAEKMILRGVHWNYLVIDEAHRIKNEKSVLSQIVRLFSTKHRLLLTGTPLQNNLQELWALLNFLMPQVFTSAQNFSEWFDLSKSTEDDREFMVKQLHRILRPFMLRRLKREVESKLPAKRELYVFLGLTPIQSELYKRILKKNIDVVNGFSERAQLMNTIMQLRKCCNHPYLFEGMEPGPPYFDGDHIIDASMKFKFLDKLLPRLLDIRHKILIFSQMTRLLDILDDYLNYRGFRFCRIDGSTSYLDREMQIERFQAPDSEYHIFILSTRAGGLGINLQAANTVIIYDSDWNPQVDIQAMDRAHRIGQKREVTVYRFIVEDSVEEKIAERAARKLKMDHLVIQRGSLAAQSKAPNAAELSSIVAFGAQQVLKTTGETIPEEDIDRILEYAQSKTNLLKEELSKLEETFNLQDFSMDGTTLYKLDEQKAEPKQHIDLGARERKSTGFYDVEKFTSLAKKTKKKGWRAQVGGGHPHQFFDAEALDELDLREESWNDYLTNKTRKRTRGEPPLEKPERFTEKDKVQRKMLMTRGFATWTKKDFSNFIRGCETHGRFNHFMIAQEIQSKTAKEVKKYSKHFWAKLDLLSNGEEYAERIAQGEEDLARVEHIAQVLKTKQLQEPDIEAVTLEGRGNEEYSLQEDQFLVKSMILHTYGNWDDCRVEVKRHPNFRFNFWLQSKTNADLETRCDSLIELLEQEQGLRPKKRAKMSVEVTAEYDWVISLPDTDSS